MHAAGESLDGRVQPVLSDTRADLVAVVQLAVTLADPVVTIGSIGTAATVLRMLAVVTATQQRAALQTRPRFVSRHPTPPRRAIALARLPSMVSDVA
jgi:hypothetical protein